MSVTRMLFIPVALLLSILMKRFKSTFYFRLNSRLLAIYFGLVRTSPFLLIMVLGVSDCLTVSEIIHLIPFKVFLMLLILFLK